MEKIVCVAGPTASGKTRLAVELAKAYDGEVLSCDSMQIYRGMDVGTAKPTDEEMQEIPHHMIDIAEPDEDFSVGRYVEMADACVQDVLSRGKTAVIAGGTGLYMDSLIAGRSFAPVPALNKKSVGMFYFLWLGSEERMSGKYNITRLLKGCPDELWDTNGTPNSPVNTFHYWNEPLFGYYRSDDKWVLAKHMEMLTLAGVDFLYLDATNASMTRNCKR